MSDRVAVVRDGRIEQIATPADLYERPNTDFVAGFVGVTNLLSGTTATAILGSDDLVSIRPEKIRIAALSGPRPQQESEATADGTVLEEIYLGASTRYVVDLDSGGRLIVQQQNHGDPDALRAVERGHRVRLSWHRAHALPVTGEPAVTQS